MSRLGSVLTQAAEDSPITFDVDDIRSRVVRRRRFRRAAGSSVGVLLVVAAVVLVVSGDGGQERIDTAGSPEDVRLVGRWTPIAYSDVTVGADGAFIEFGADGLFNGFNGCNGFGGSWRLDGDRLNVGEIMQNKNACDPSEVIAPIIAILDGDPKASRFDDQPGSLQLTSGSAFIGFETASEPTVTTSTARPASSTSTTVEPASPLLALSLGHDRLGPLRVGMTVVEAEQAIGENVIEVEGDLGNGCFSYRPISTTAIGFLVVDGRIVVIQTIGVETDAGIAVGDTEDAISTAYAGEDVDAYVNRLAIRQVVVRPTSDSAYATIFVLDPSGSVVKQVNAGSLPAVEQYDEGCA